MPITYSAEKQGRLMTGFYYPNGTDSGLTPVYAYRKNSYRDVPDKRKRPVPATLSSGTSMNAYTEIWADAVINTFTPSYRFVGTIHGTLGSMSTPKGYTLDTASTFGVELRNNLRQKFRGEHMNLALLIAEYSQTSSMFSEYAKKVHKVGELLFGLGTTTAAQSGLLERKASNLQKSIQRAQRAAAHLSKNDLTRERRRARQREKQMQKELKDIRRAAERLSKAAAKEHLAIMYGVIPLMSDMNLAVRDLRKPPNFETRFVKAKSSRFLSSSGQEVVNSTPPGSAIKGHRLVAGRRLVKYVAQAYATNTDLRTYLGAWGLTNPASLLWEKIPYSFVVDWFINVGEVLASLDNAFYTGGAVYQMIDKITQTYVTSWSGATAYYSKTSYYRSSVLDLSQVAEFRYKESASKQHFINGVALLRTAKR